MSKPSWVNDDLVACIDGPMAGQWFTRDDWDARICGARYLADERQQRPQACLSYVSDGNRVDHPKENCSGEALTYRPTTTPGGAS